MERRVIFRDGMDNDPADFTNLQNFAQGSVDHLVGDAVTRERRYAGFDAVASGVTELTVQPGRYYSAGRVYDRADVFVRDLTTSLPIATRKILALCVYGDTVQTDARPREFLINEETNASEPRTVAMEEARVAVLTIAAGEENADPVPPIVGANVTVVATIMLTPAGIHSVTMNGATALDSVGRNAQRVSSLETFRDRTAPQISAIASDLAALAKGQRGIVSGEAYGRSLARLAVLEARAGIPQAAVDSAADFFLDLGQSDPAFPGYLAKVEEGIRFADEAASERQLQMFDPLNPRARVLAGTMFPAHSQVRRMGLAPRSGELQVSAYSYATHEMVQKTASRIRIRYGSSRTVCTNSAWWQTGRYDPVTRTFRIDGETWEVDVADAAAAQGHAFIRLTQYWEDRYEENYWDAITVQHQVNGAQVAETFLQANDMWLSAVGLTFTRLAANGSITLAICETDRGMPLLDKVISRTIVEREDLLVNEETVIPVQPVFLEGGSRYAIVVITAADHWLATVQGSVYPQGTMFYVLDGAYQQGDATRDIMFSLYAMEFTASRAVVELQALELAGGISDIDIVTPAIVPGSTQLTFEVQIGGAWHPLARAQGLVLGAGGNIPPLLPFRAVFTGTPDAMPALTLAGSRVRVSRPRTTLTHVSSVRALPGAGSDTVRVLARLEYFREADHDAGCVLLVGADYQTVVQPTGMVDEVADDGSIERSWIFDLADPVTDYRIRCTASTVSPLNIFHFGWRKDFAL